VGVVLDTSVLIGAEKGRLDLPMLYDLLVAATALSLGFSLATLNEEEFKRVPGLTLFTLSV
jgi:predicted nucleic acid-binding protein